MGQSITQNRHSESHTNPNSHSVLDTESVNADYKLINSHHYK